MRFLSQFRKYLPPEILVFFFMLCTVYLYVLQQQFIYFRVCILIAGNHCNYSLTHNDSSSCVENKKVDQIQSLASYLLLATNLVSNVPSIFVSLILGPLSDLVGRKISIYIPIIFNICFMVCMLCINYFNLHPYYILIGSALLGLGGNFSILIMSLSAYVVDSVSEKYRVLRIGLLESSITLASFVGNMSGGEILEAIGFNYFFVLNILILLLLLMYAVVLKESMERENHSQISISREGLFQYVFLIVKPIRLFCTNKKPVKFFVLIFAFSFTLTAIFGNFDIFTLYALGPPMCWLPHLIGYYYAFSYLASSIGIMLFLPILIKFRISDYILIILASFDIMLIYALIGSFQDKLVLLVAVPLIGSLRLFAAPSTKSALSGLISREDYGSLFALLSVQSTLIQLTAAAVFHAIYPTLRLIYEGLCFYILSAGNIVPIVLCVTLYLYEKCCEKTEKISSDQDAEGNQVTDETKPLINDH